MAGEVKYGNTLVSSRKDETLTYARYVKDLKSGKNVEEVLEDLRNSSNIASIGTTDIDSIWNDTTTSGTSSGISSEGISGTVIGGSTLPGGTIINPDYSVEK